MVNKLSALLVFTWMIVIPSILAWEANAELPESTGAVCELPKAVKVAPFTCKGKEQILPARDDLFYKRGETSHYPRIGQTKEIYCE